MYTNSKTIMAKLGIIGLIFFSFISFGYSQVIFENNFNDHSEMWVGTQIGHIVAGSHEGLPGVGVPKGWTGYINHSPQNDIRIITSGGHDNSPCLRIGPEYSGLTNQVGIALALPNLQGNYDGSGYDEIYIRFYVKYSDNFDWIHPDKTFYYQKWLRIWQNVPLNRLYGNPPEGDEPAQSMSREENTGYILVGVGEDNYGEFSPYFYGMFCRDFADNSSSGRAVGRWNFNYSPGNNGFIENYLGNINSEGRWDEVQTWHCWEFHIRLADSWEADNGIFEIFIDGELQTDSGFRMQQNPFQNPATGGVNYGPPPRLGVGINYISIHDNADSFGLSEQGYIYIDDVVVSTEYIGPKDSSSSQISAPRNLIIVE